MAHYILNITLFNTKLFHASSSRPSIWGSVCTHLTKLYKIFKKFYVITHGVFTEKLLLLLWTLPILYFKL